MRKIKTGGLLAGLAIIIVAGLALSIYLATVMDRSLFEGATWLVWLAPFFGLAAAGLTKRDDPRIEGGEVLRHDKAAILEHWTHGLGTTIALVSGVLLGFLIIPVLVSRDVPVRMALNVHFFAVLIFLFGTFYYAGNSFLATKRVKEHLPTKNAISYTIQHYGHLLGFKKCKMPPEEKYFESEKVAYLMAIGGSLVIIVTGFFKVAARTWAIPGEVLGGMTLVHDIAAAVMILFLLPHLLFSTVLPSAWPVFKSMITGYVSRDYAEKDHQGWITQLEDAQSKETPTEGSTTAPGSEKSVSPETPSIT